LSHAESYEERLKTIVQLAEKALITHRERRWIEANQQLIILRDRIVETLAQETQRRRPSPPRERPDPRVIKLQLGIHLTQLRENARQQDQLAAFEKDFQACDQALKAIDAGASDAMTLLRDYYQHRHAPLEAKVGMMRKHEDKLAMVLMGRRARD
jgi:hypothetical protein